MKGHTGTGWGLVSSMFWDPKTKRGFTFCVNGAMHGYDRSTTSSFLYVDQ